MSQQSCENPFAMDRLNTAADFLPEWDVPSLGETVTAALVKDIDAVRSRPLPDPGRKIHLIVGPAGYGKTHLFGRVQHEQKERIQFVFVSSVPDASRATETVRYQVVETLFHAANGHISPLHRHLAHLFGPSFIAYLEQLPAGLRAKCTELRQALAKDTGRVLDVTRLVTDVVPYHALADSIRQRWPNLPGGVVRALVLGWSPAAQHARVWLRGEASQISEERLNQLCLDEIPPDPVDVLRTVGMFLSRIEVPLVLCLDQLDQIHAGSPSGFQELTTQLMNWLAVVPGLIVVLGCVEAGWKEIQGRQTLAAFVDRLRQHELTPLDSAAARDLVTRRMRSWEGFEPTQRDGWPFDLAAIEQFTLRLPTSPRRFIERCDFEFNRWEADGKKGLISLNSSDQPVETPLADQFREEWDKRLAATQATLKAPADYQDAELWAGIDQALQIAQAGQYVLDGSRFERFQRNALRSSPNDTRPSAELHLIAGEQRVRVVVAVSKKDSGVAFGKWYEALAGALGETVAGAVVVWPKSKLAVGKTSKAFIEYQKHVTQKTVRPFPLDANESSFAQMECLRRLIADAEAGMLALSGNPLSVKECRQHVVETKILAELPLFEMLFQNWPIVEEAREKVAKPVALKQQSASIVTPTPAQIAPVPSARHASVGAQTKPSVITSVPSLFSPEPLSPAPTINGHPWAREMLGKVVEKLRSRGQPVRPLGAEVGPTFVRLKVEPEEDTDFSKVKRQADNLKLHLGLDVKPVIGSRAGFISIDVIRPDRQTVPLAPILDSRPANGLSGAAFPLGVDVAGQAEWLNLAEPATCHLLVAGTTGSGKSQLLKSLIASLCHKIGPDGLQLILIDPKQVTFTFTGASPYLAHPVVFDAMAALPVIEGCYQEMERRYTLLRKQGKEHIGELPLQGRVPRWVVVFDEFADLMLGDKVTKKELEALLKRLGAKARAAGIHLILGTQRPEASVVTPLLRANLPGRISLQVASERESKLILDEPDAAHLLDKGDLLWRRGGALVRLQSPYVSRETLEQYLRLH